jgi:hypothetical protein
MTETAQIILSLIAITLACFSLGFNVALYFLGGRR